MAEEKIKNFYYSPQKSLYENAEKLAEENSQKFNIQEMDKTFHGLLDKYIPEFSVEQKIVLPKLKKISDQSPQPPQQKIVLPKLKKINV